MRKVILFLSLLAFFIAGCGPSLKEVNALNFGPPPKTVSMKHVRKLFNIILKDPYSAKIRFANTPPRKAYIFSKINGEVEWAGWAKEVGVNAKNSFGAYTGEKTYYVTVDKYGMVDKIYNSVGGEVLGIYASQLRMADDLYTQ